VHVAPRYPNTPTEVWGTRLNQWPDAPQVDPNEMRVIVSNLREGLTSIRYRPRSLAAHSSWRARRCRSPL
jgi:hypothetical protein